VHKQSETHHLHGQDQRLRSVPFVMQLRVQDDKPPTVWQDTERRRGHGRTSHPAWHSSGRPRQLRSGHRMWPSRQKDDDKVPRAALRPRPRICPGLPARCPQVPLPCQSRGAASDTEHRSEYLTVTSWLARPIDGYFAPLRFHPLATRAITIPLRTPLKSEEPL
jgi:hypothetical protein